MLKSERIVCRHTGLGIITWDRKERIYCVWSKFDPIGFGGFVSVIEAFKYLKKMRKGH
jgi:hypothetical protein